MSNTTREVRNLQRTLLHVKRILLRNLRCEERMIRMHRTNIGKYQHALSGIDVILGEDDVEDLVEDDYEYQLSNDEEDHREYQSSDDTPTGVNDSSDDDDDDTIADVDTSTDEEELPVETSRHKRPIITQRFLTPQQQFMSETMRSCGAPTKVLPSNISFGRSLRDDNPDATNGDLMREANGEWARHQKRGRRYNKLNKRKN